MREKAIRIKSVGELVDTCGTGGDGAHTFNISTISAFVIAGAGVKVAKHGNRSVSSRCGSADLLAGLGVNLELSPEGIEKCIEEVGIGFLFAPALHASMKYAIGPRREIGIRTIFNILGPLTNPAFAKRQLLGVYDPKLTEPLAKVLYNLGSDHVFVVHGFDGLDEVTITNSTRITELKDGEIKTYNVAPEDFGLRRGEMSELKGGDVEDNIKIALDILKGGDGARRDIVLLNAGFAIVAGGKAETVRDGIELAKRSIQTGEALKRLELLRKFTTSFKS
jgi:anthranilate phosphoribosyltransferase